MGHLLRGCVSTEAALLALIEGTRVSLVPTISSQGQLIRRGTSHPHRRSLLPLEAESFCLFLIQPFSLQDELKLATLAHVFLQGGS